MIIDAHLHLPCYDDGLSLQDKKLRLLSDLADAGICGGIVIADSELSSVIGTTEECVELFADVENIFVMGGVSPLIDYEVRLSALEQFLIEKKIVALKLYPGHEVYFMDDTRLAPVFALCEKYDVPLAVHTGWDNPQYNRPHFFADIARNRPTLKIVICHLCWPDIDLCYEVTAAYPNIYYDISSLAYKTDLLEGTSASLRRMADTHADRIVLGSDYGACSIQGHIDLVRSLNIGRREEQIILADNAISLYKLSLPPRI